MNPTGMDFAQRGRVAHPGPCTSRERRFRMAAVAVLALFWVGVVIYRLVGLQINDASRWQDWALKQHESEIQVASERGAITDRNNRLLAISVPAISVYARPRALAERRTDKELIKSLATILDLPEKSIRTQLAQDKPFLWLARQVPREMGEEIDALKLASVGYVLESRRYYPYGRAASTLIGKVGTDGIGLSGVERSFNEQLAADEMKSRFVRDALGNRIQAEDGLHEFEPPQGESLQLTIDANIQMIMDEELEAGRLSAKARSAMAVMIDSETGEILSMSQSPQADFNKKTDLDPRFLRNFLAETVYEPGSTIKPMVMAAALELGVAKANEVVDCEHGRLVFARHVINDVHPYDQITFRDVLVRSSNIGMTKLGIRLGAQRLHSYLSSFGFGTASGLALPGESRGLLRSVDKWAQVDIATHSYGQGFAVTPLQMVRAVASLANGGRVPSLRVVRSDTAFESRRVVSERSAQLVRDMLFDVVEDKHGTGKQAKVDGIRVGGKTGTAQKPRKDGRGYDPGKYIASFVGFADGSALGVRQMPTMIVIIDEPNTDTIYGGTLAAPVFKRIMQRSMAYLSMRDQSLPLVTTPPEPSKLGQVSL